MAFNSLEYALFFALVFCAFWSLRRFHRVRTVLLCVASAWFYTRFDYGPGHARLGWVYLAVLFTSAVVDFVLARAIYNTDFSSRPLPTRERGSGGEVCEREGGSGGEVVQRDADAIARRRKHLLVLSIVYNLGVLAWFKYTNFGIDSVRAVLDSAGIHVHPRVVNVILPIGISFFTFETMSYTIDVYRRELVPAKSFLEYLLFISFFPHLVAGPIIRPKDMLPQLRVDPTLDAERGSQGLFLIACGLLKKIVIADYLAVNLVDRVFDRAEWFSGTETLAGVYAYALQIYCDFSGYTDIAIGSALLLGYVLPKNFDSPYQSTSLQEFWHRWHISLSSWLRDYLYIPLGGSKGGAWKTYRNLMITMLLGGLWHGASWNFVLWGAMHGVALAGTRMWQRWRGRAVEGVARRTATTTTTATATLKGVLTFHYVCLAWVFFRADSFRSALGILRQIVRGGAHAENLGRGILLCMFAGFVTHLIPDGWFTRVREGFVRMPALAQGAVLFVVALVLREVATSAAVPFVYYQF